MVVHKGRFGLVTLLDGSFCSQSCEVQMISGGKLTFTSDDFYRGDVSVVIKTKSIHRWDNEAIAYRKALVEIREDYLTEKAIKAQGSDRS